MKSLENDANNRVVVVSNDGIIHVRLMQVYAVKLVKAACFYGYNPNPEPFLRISLCAPEPVATVYP